MTDQLAQTIRTYITAGNIDAVISLADALKADRDRAELKVAAYLHEIKVLAQRFAAITEPATGHPVRETRITVESKRDRGLGKTGRIEVVDRPSEPKSKPKAKSKPSVESVDIEF